MKKIQSYYPGKCARCGGAIAKGESVMYDANGERGKKVYHPGCASAAAVTPAKASMPSAPYSGTELPDRYYHYRRHYDSVEDFCAVLPSETNAPILAKWLGHHDATKGAHWYGVPTADETARVVRDGWPEGLARLEQMLTHEIPPLLGVKRRLRRGDYGDEIDIHSVYRGHLDRAWSRRVRTQALNGHGQKTILFNAMTNFGIDAETLFWRGAAMVRVCDALTEAGYDVEIIVQKSNERIDEREQMNICDTFTLKPMHMPLNKMAVTTVVCLAGFTRVFGFRHINRIPELVNDGFGASVTVLPDDLKERDLITGFENIQDRRGAQRLIDQTLAGLRLARAA